MVRLQCWTANGAIKQLFFRQTFFSWPIFQTQIIRLQKKGKGSREKIFGRIEEKAKILELKETFKKNHILSGWESACWKHFHQLVDMKIRNFLIEALGEDECASLSEFRRRFIYSNQSLGGDLFIQIDVVNSAWCCLILFLQSDSDDLSEKRRVRGTEFVSCRRK